MQISLILLQTNANSLTGIGTVHYFNLLLVKYGSETIVSDENEKILAKVSIFNQDFYKASFYDAAEQIDDLSAY